MKQTSATDIAWTFDWCIVLTAMLNI